MYHGNQRFKKMPISKANKISYSYFSHLCFSKQLEVTVTMTFWPKLWLHGEYLKGMKG